MNKGIDTNIHPNVQDTDPAEIGEENKLFKDVFQSKNQDGVYSPKRFSEAI